jgi:hypothetical protein
MTKQRLLSQALMGGLLFFGISLILEKSFSPEALQTAAVKALIFALVYGAGLWAYYKFKKE